MQAAWPMPIGFPRYALYTDIIPWSLVSICAIIQIQITNRENDRYFLANCETFAKRYLLFSRGKVVFDGYHQPKRQENLQA